MTMNHATRLWLGGLAVRLTLIAIAAMLIAVGYTLLTSPLVIPVTIGLWLGGATMAAWGVFGELPDHE